ncbi:hypothetical protein CHLNCDRAFT_22490, partial [Chlorella variabilis]
PAAPKGVYLHGSVGSGKSLAMDLFSAAVLREGTVPHHRRLHFNSAMLELHRRAPRPCMDAEGRLDESRSAPWAVPSQWPCCSMCACASLVLPGCPSFLPQAVALKGLVEALLAEGCVVVATSNRAPWELDRHGLHEDLFEHFRASLQAACDVVCLDSGRDYRRLLAASTLLRPLPAAGAAAGAGRATDDRQQQEQQRGAGRELGVMFGRRLHVARCAGGAARFSFPELCAVPLGTADYVALSQTFHTVFLEGVPPLSMQARGSRPRGGGGGSVRDQARRFISLVDELYNHRTRLVCTAAAPPDQLFSGAGAEGEGILDLEGLQAAAAAARLGGAEERFAFARAVSRLYEMQGELYLASRPRQP